MNSLTEEFIQNLAFTNSDLSTLRRLGEYKGLQDSILQTSPDSLGILSFLAKVESVESSNRLEGIMTEHEIIKDLVLKDTKPNNRTEQEIAGYRDALSGIHMGWEGIEFSESSIKYLHKVMYKYLPYEGGNYKDRDNFIIEELPNGTKRLRFEPVPWKEIPRHMAELVTLYEQNNGEKADPLVVIPLVAFDFLCIHPFLDGNGRMARLLTILLLHKTGFFIAKYISLERAIEDTRKSYYETLERSSKNWHKGKHDIFPWLRYFWGVLLSAYEEFEERTKLVSTKRGTKKEMIYSTVERQIGLFSISEIIDQCPGISRDMIKLTLREMKEKSMIEAVGKGRGAKWRRKRILNNGSHQPDSR